MTLNPPAEPQPRLTPTQWLICAIAAIGFAFDIYELLMAQFIVRPALMELGKLTPGTAQRKSSALRKILPGGRTSILPLSGYSTESGPRFVEKIRTVPGPVT